MSLLLLMAINSEVMPATVRLVAVVSLTAVLLCSQDILENKVTGNVVLAKIGAASYSIFIWHQILLAFCRYAWASEFPLGTYALLLLGTAVLSWLTYRYVEQGVNRALKTKGGKTGVYALTAVVFVLLTGYAVYIYTQGGVVRDVPELYISKKDRADHKAYNDKIYNLDKPFETNKRHWLVIGNSFGRDFANVILESEVADSIELSYIYMDDYANKDNAQRFAEADKIFLSSLGTDEELVSQVESVCLTNGFDINHLVIVGTKNFGESNGQFYVKRGASNYFAQRTEIDTIYKDTNDRLKAVYGRRYLDLIGLVIDDKGTMPVFTPDHHYVSQDCRHFSKGGAKWFATLIDWSRFM